MEKAKGSGETAGADVIRRALSSRRDGDIDAVARRNTFENQRMLRELSAPRTEQSRAPRGMLQVSLRGSFKESMKASWRGAAMSVSPTTPATRMSPSESFKQTDGAATSRARSSVKFSEEDVVVEVPARHTREYQLERMMNDMDVFERNQELDRAEKLNAWNGSWFVFGSKRAFRWSARAGSS